MASGSSKRFLVCSSETESDQGKRMKMAIGGGRPAPSFTRFTELLPSDSSVVKAMVCHSWDAKSPSGKYLGTEYILSDDQGTALHCVARSSLAHCIVPRLNVGDIYNSGRFSFVKNKEIYRVRRDDPYMIQFEGNTTIQQIDSSCSGFTRHPFHLQDIDKIVVNDNKHLIDVIGLVINVGVPKPTRNGSQYIELQLMNERSQTVKATLWGSLCEEVVRRSGQSDSLDVIILPAMNIREYKGSIQLTSTSGTSIFESKEIPEIANFLHVMGSVQIPLPDNRATLQQLLQLGREQKEAQTEFVTLYVSVEIIGVRARNSWNYYSCGFGGCKKELTPQLDHFWCEACERKCEYPVVRYRLQLDVGDGNTTSVVTIFDEIAESLINKKASVLMASFGDEDIEGEIPQQILRLVGSRHVFELKTHTNYDHGHFESFTTSDVRPFTEPCKLLIIKHVHDFVEDSKDCSNGKPSFSSPSKEDKVAFDET